jgi:copper chaperone CopZ
MDFNTTLDIIIKDLREAREIIDDLKNYPGVPTIQVELAKSKCKSAEEIIALLKTMKQEYQGSYGKIVEGVEEVVAVVEELKQPVVEIFAIEDEIAVPKKSKKKPEEKNIVADKFSGMPETFNEQLGNKTGDGDISNIIKSRPVSNLTDAIGINDKFLFVREIFNGDQLSYNEAITKLNNTDNLADAKAVIMSYTVEGDENNAVKQLLDLVKRKLPADE